MRVIARIGAAFATIGLVAGSIAFPVEPTYTIREDRGAGEAQEPMYWIYAGGWPFGMVYHLEAGFDSRDRALEYVYRARQRDKAEREGKFGEAIIP